MSTCHLRTWTHYFDDIYLNEHSLSKESPDCGKASDVHRLLGLELDAMWSCKDSIVIREVTVSPPTLLQYFLLRGAAEMRGWGQEGVGCVVSPKLVLAKGGGVEME